MPQSTSTLNMSSVAKTIIAGVRYTQQHNAPSMAAIEQMSLQKGASTKTVPKVANMTMADLVDGQDIVDEESIGMTTVDLTANEVGARIVVTDKLVRESDPQIYSMVSRQLGEGMAKKNDTDVQALYASASTVYGAAAAVFSVANFSASIANARGKTEPFNPTYAIVHPHTAYDYVNTSTPIGSSNAWPEDMSKERMGKFWTGRTFNQVTLMESGNLIADTSDDVIGILAQKDAHVVLMSQQTRTERQRDASLRGTEIVMTSDYGVFELDDNKCAQLLFDAAAVSTTA